MTNAHEAPLHVGKLPPDLLAQLLEQANIENPSVILGPRVGEDAALIDNGGENYLVVSSDPITFAAEQLGWYAVHVNANDIAATGGTPRWMVMTVILPDGSGPQLAKDIMRQTLEACAEIGVTLVGGHTEVTSGIDRPIAIGTMIGDVRKGKETPTSGVQEGDAIILTKGVGIEGTAILAIERADRLRASWVSVETIRRAADFLYDPGISVARDAQVALGAASVHAMHDPTEGGIATALHEMADASSVGLEINADTIKAMTLPVTVEICRALRVNPAGLIASGALIIAVAAEDSSGVLAALQGASIQAAEVGRAVPRSRGANIPRFPRDELARILSD